MAAGAGDAARCARLRCTGDAFAEARGIVAPAAEAATGKQGLRAAARAHRSMEYSCRESVRGRGRFGKGR